MRSQQGSSTTQARLQPKSPDGTTERRLAGGLPADPRLLYARYPAAMKRNGEGVKNPSSFSICSSVDSIIQTGSWFGGS